MPAPYSLHRFILGDQVPCTSSGLQKSRTHVGPTASTSPLISYDHLPCALACRNLIICCPARCPPSQVDVALGTLAGLGGKMQLSIIERAFQLASSGQFQSLHLIERALAKEGYEGAYLHLRGRALRSDLNLRIREGASR